MSHLPTRVARPSATRLALIATLSSASLLTAGVASVSAARLPDVTVKVDHTVIRVEGSAGSDSILLRVRPNETGILQVLADGRQVGNIDRSRFREIDVRAGAGNDTVLVDESFGVFNVPISIDGGDGADVLVGDIGPVLFNGGAGNDLLVGGDGVDQLLGGDGNDTIDGDKGADVAFGNGGNDTFIWDPGDGSDSFDGQDGRDTLVFNGSAGNEKFELSSNDNGRLRFTRDLGGITMDIGTTESVIANAEGGADTVTVDDLQRTDVTNVVIDLAAAPGSGTGDTAADDVIVRGTAKADAFVVTSRDGTATVAGLHAAVDIRAPEFAKDRLDIDTGDGLDSVDATGLAAGVIPLFVDGLAF
jgi:hemolysin type calcium-binding protein